MGDTRPGWGSLRESRMTRIQALIAAASLVAMAGCSTSKARYDAVQTSLSGSATMRSTTISGCIERQNKRPLAERQSLASLMKVPVDAGPRTACQRMVDGLSSGELTHQDMQSIQQGRPTANLIRVLQGR
jgi:hypothetical protein